MSLTGQQAISIAQKIVADIPAHEKEAWLCRQGYTHADVERAMQAVWATAKQARQQ